MLVFALAIIIKVIYIQQKQGEELLTRVKKLESIEDTIRADRGNIYSETGALLSSTIPEFNLHVDFATINKDTFYKYVDSLAYRLSMTFRGESPNTWRSKLVRGYQKGFRFWALKKGVSYKQYEKVRNFPIFNKGLFKGGLIVEAKPKRVNPYGFLAYRTIGLWRENAPSVGLERGYDSVLAGHYGVRLLRTTTGGVRIPIKGSEVDPVHGKDIVTTIDIDVQDVTEHALQDVLEKYECTYGTAIVMEVKTGKIIALANLGRQKDGSYHEDLNYALLPTEPGSTFKLFSLMALLDDGYMTLEDKVNVGNGVAYFGKQRIRDDHGGLGTITAREALQHSSNVAFAKMVNHNYQKNPDKFLKHLRNLHLNEKTGIDIPGERAPMIKTTKSKLWNKAASLPMIAYGYESLVSPLHTCMVYNAVANNGKMMKPYLVSQIKEYGKVVEEIRPTVLVNQIAKPSTIRDLKDALHAVVEKGTARAIRSPYYNFGGKTGTAQVADKGISYADGVRQGSFVGFFPLEDPQYTICVLARSKPHGAYYGSILGAPVFKAIADRLYASKIGGWEIPDSLVKANKTFKERMLNDTYEPLAQRLNWPTDNLLDQMAILNVGQNEQKRLGFDRSAIKYGTIPNLQGLGLKDALELLGTESIRITISGVGKVRQQSLPEGTKINGKQTLHLVLG